MISLALFAMVTLAAMAVTVIGLQYSADTVGRIAAAAPVKTTNLRPGYTARLAVAKADDLDIARSVPVTPIAPKAPGPLVVSSASSPAPESARPRPQVLTLENGRWVDVSDTTIGWVLAGDASGGSIRVHGSLLRPAHSAAAQFR